MIVSIATAVLPVWRSPMISSRWPRPIGTIESIDFRPVCTGWLTDWRAITPGATFSITSVILALIGPLPSIGWPSALTTRPISSGPTGTSQDAAGALDGVAFGDVLVLAQDHRADRVALEVQRQAEGRLAVRRRRELEHFALHRVRQAVDAADAVGHRHHGALVADVRRGAEALDAALDQFGNFCGIQLHGFLLRRWRSSGRARPSSVRAGP